MGDGLRFMRPRIAAVLILLLSTILVLSSCGALSSSGVIIPPGTAQISLRSNSILVGPAGGTAAAALVAHGNGTPVTWTASTGTSWIHLTDTNGSTAALGSVARFLYDSNPGGTRSGTITYLSAGFSGTFTVTQAGAGYVATLPAPTTLLTLPSLSAFAVDLAGNVYFVPNYWSDTSATLQEWVAATGSSVPLSFPAAGQCGAALTEATALFVNDAEIVVGNTPGTCPAFFGTQPVDLTLQWTPGTAQSVLLANESVQTSNYWAGVTPDWHGNYFAAVSVQGAGGISTATTGVYIDGGGSLLAPPMANLTRYFATGLTGDTNGWLYLTGTSTGNVPGADYSIMRVNSTTAAVSELADLGNTISNGLAVDGSGNLYFLVQDQTAQNPSTYLDYYLAQWNVSTGQVTRLSATGAIAQIYGDGVGNIYAETPQRVVQEFTPVFVNTTAKVEPASAGSDQLAPVIPASTEFTAVSDSPWLTITGQSEGAVSFSFTATTVKRTGHISFLGDSIAVTQQ